MLSHFEFSCLKTAVDLEIDQLNLYRPVKSQNNKPIILFSSEVSLLWGGLGQAFSRDKVPFKM